MCVERSEIKLLQELNHPNVLKLMDIFNHHSNINLVLEYMTGDLEQLLRGLAAQHKPLPHGDIKAYMKMILQGMEHCHNSWILHRDMKPVRIHSFRHCAHAHAHMHTGTHTRASLLARTAMLICLLFFFISSRLVRLFQGNLLIGTDGCVKIGERACAHARTLLHSICSHANAPHGPAMLILLQLSAGSAGLCLSACSLSASAHASRFWSCQGIRQSRPSHESPSVHDLVSRAGDAVGRHLLRTRRGHVVRWGHHGRNVLDETNVVSQ